MKKGFIGMTDYISREEAIEETCNGCSFEFSGEPCEPCGCGIMARLKAIPAADVRPATHGKWKHVGTIENTWIVCACTACGAQTIDAGAYCTNCGAEMLGGRA